MEPMKPMEAMKPMEPIKPMTPMAAGESWWPQALGGPSSRGSQNGVRYAFFPNARRLLLQRDDVIEQYDTGDHQIQGVAQASDQAGGLASFTSQHGTVDLASLKRVSGA
jgi:hypothetical protein